MGGKVGEGDEDTKEADDMKDKNGSFNFR